MTRDIGYRIDFINYCRICRWSRSIGFWRDFRDGFTLAEVLVTLGIIGVVAALTIPSLIQKYQEKVWTTSFLRVYNILNNAYLNVQNDYGTFENWSGGTIVTDSTNGIKITTESNPMLIYNIMIKPNIKLSDSFLEKGVSNCMPDKSYSLNGEIGENGLSKYVPAVSLISGECIGIGASTGEFFVDLNGKKNPNTLGKDQFHIAFNPYYPERLKPDWTTSVSYCDKSSSHGWRAGMSCGYWVLANKNMDYLHMPFDELQTKWKNFSP